MLVHSISQAALVLLANAGSVTVHAATIGGSVEDTNGQPLPGVTVDVAPHDMRPIVAVTNAAGSWSADAPQGAYDVTYRLIN